MFMAALGVVFSRNPVHSVMFLVFTFFNAAILWLLAEAEFLGIVLVLVYVGAILFSLSVAGIFLNRKNVILLLMCIELMLLAVNINLVAFSTHLQDLVGQVFAMFVLTVAAAEAAIGLAILVVYFRNRGSIEVEDVNMMKG